MRTVISDLEKMLQQAKANQQYTSNLKTEELSRHAAEVDRYDAELHATSRYIDELEAVLKKLMV